jgi:predicted HicB family RNase H-like nuclease
MESRTKRIDKHVPIGYNSSKGVKIMPKIDAQLGIRVTKDLKARLTAQAKSEMKSVSTLVVEVVEAYLDSKGMGKQQ